MSVHFSSFWEEHPEASLGNKLKDSSDPVVKHAKAQVSTRRKWDTSQAVHQVKLVLKYQEVVGSIQHSRADFGWTTSTKMWSKAIKIEMKRLIVQEVMKEEEESYKVKAVSKYLQSSHTSMGSDDAIQITYNQLLHKIADTCKSSDLPLQLVRRLLNY